MLTIKRLKRYTVPKYPSGKYHPKIGPVAALGKGILIPAAIAALIDSCRPIGVMGPPPMRPRTVSENEAREIIDPVFHDNGIIMQHDVPYKLSSGREVVFDGFIQSKKAGYEYVNEHEVGEFFEENEMGGIQVRKDIQKEKGLHVYIKGPSEWYGERTKETIKADVARFIRELKAAGIL